MKPARTRAPRATVSRGVGDEAAAGQLPALPAGAGSAKTLDANGIMAFKIDDHGTISESWFLYNDRRAYDDFFS